MLATSLVLLAASVRQEIPPAPREFRGAWVATVDNIDWPSKKGLPTDELRRELDAIVAKAVELKLNALIFQVRPLADALYPSPLEPWGEWITGEQGKAPKPALDPLKYMVDECHKHGLELHAWFNPYRAWHPASKSKPSFDHVTQRHPNWIKNYGAYKWMDPGNPEVAEETLRVIDDVVTRYDLDGVHIDDYFYPYPVNNLPFPDDDTYRSYQRKGGRLGRSDWRRSNVDSFVHNLYDQVKRKKKWVKVGISPFGIYRPGIPQGIQAGFDQYDGMYADAKKWLQEGWCDYMAPQLYWKISQVHQAYEPLLRWWISQNTKKRHIWPGNFTSRLYEGDWQASEIVEQVALTRRTPGAGGNIHFSMKAFLMDSRGIDKAIQAPYANDALVPESPWLGTEELSAPKLTVFDKGLSFVGIFSTEPKEASKVRQWAIWFKQGGNWSFRTERSELGGFSLWKDSVKPLEKVVVAAQDRSGALSPYAIWTAPRR